MVHSQSLEEKFCFFPFAIRLKAGLQIASEFCEKYQKGIIYLPTAASSFFHLMPDVTYGDSENLTQSTQSNLLLSYLNRGGGADSVLIEVCSHLIWKSSAGLGHEETLKQHI